MNAMSDALRSFVLDEDDSDEADDECELCAGVGELVAVTARQADSGRSETEHVGCPLCIVRAHSRRAREALSEAEGSTP